MLRPETLRNDQETVKKVDEEDQESLKNHVHVTVNISINDRCVSYRKLLLNNPISKEKISQEIRKKKEV